MHSYDNFTLLLSILCPQASNGMPMVRLLSTYVLVNIDNDFLHATTTSSLLDFSVVT